MDRQRPRMSTPEYADFYDKKMCEPPDLLEEDVPWGDIIDEFMDSPHLMKKLVLWALENKELAGKMREAYDYVMRSRGEL